LAFEIASCLCVYRADLGDILGSGWVDCGVGLWGQPLGGVDGGRCLQRWLDGDAIDPIEQKLGRGERCMCL